MQKSTINIRDVIGGGICVSPDDGLKVYEAVTTEIQKGNRVELSFSGVTRLTTAFLNVAVGQLYGDFAEEQVGQYLAPPINAEFWHLNRLKLVVNGAKIYFQNPEARKAAYIGTTGIEDE